MLRCDWGPQWESAHLVTRAARKHSALGSKTIVTVRKHSSIKYFVDESSHWIQASAQDATNNMFSVFVWLHNIIIHPDVASYIIYLCKLYATQSFSYINHLTQGFSEPLIWPVFDGSVRGLILCLFSRWWRWPPQQQHRERRGHGRGWHPSS